MKLFLVEFKKMFNDMRVKAGEPCRLEVVVIGNPRPKVGAVCILTGKYQKEAWCHRRLLSSLRFFRFLYPLLVLLNINFAFDNPPGTMVLQQ